MPPGDKIRFIGGTGRSGTTILRRVLAAHPAVFAFPGETRFLVDPDGLVDFYDAALNSWSPTVYDRRVKRLEQLLRAVANRGLGERLVVRARRSARSGQSGGKKQTGGVKRVIDALRGSRINPAYYSTGLNEHCPSFADHVDRLIAELASDGFAGRWVGTPFGEPSIIRFRDFSDAQEIADILGEFYRAFVRDSLLEARAEVFVEDTPTSVLAFDRVLRLLPEAKLVHMIRDPRDVVASLTTMHWAPSDPLAAADWYKSVMRRWRHVRERLPDDAALTVKLEDLVSGTEQVVHEIAEFFGLPWDDALLSTDLSHSHQGRWRRDFDKTTAARIEAALTAEIEELGY